MKKVLSLSLLSIILFAFVSQTPADIEKFKRDVAESKGKAKKELDGYRYDGSKVTFFNYKPVKQTKQVEVFLFNRTEYKFSFNAELVPLNVTVKIYDADATDPNRVLLKEIGEVGGAPFEISSDDLNKEYQAKISDAPRLKRVYVVYEIPGDSGYAQANKGKISGRGAVVLAMGYKQ